MPGLNIVVAVAGSAEAATADFVCDGINDDVEINAAIQALAEAGGGTLSFGSGIFSTSRPIVVDHDNISLVGMSDHSTFIRPASDWVSIVLADGAQATGAVSFVGVDNFAARNLVVESTALPMNGIIAIPTGDLGSGTICNDGLFENNIVRMAQAHTYSIWSLRSTNIVIRGNLVDGGATFENANISQEGIEIFGGNHVEITDNTLINIGNAAINLVSLAELVDDSELSNITVSGNHIDLSRIGIFLGVTYSMLNGSQNASNITITDNEMNNIFESGFFVEIQDGVESDRTTLENLEFRNNEINLVSGVSSTFLPAAIYLYGNNDVGRHFIDDIAIVENQISLSSVMAEITAPSRLQSDNYRLIVFYNFNDVLFESNEVVSNVVGRISNGISVYLAEEITIESNNISGFQAFPIEIFQTSNSSIVNNDITDWGGLAEFGAIYLHNSQQLSIIANAVDNPSTFDGFIRSDLLSTDISFSQNRMTTDRDYSLAGSQYAELFLVGDALVGHGNALDNYIRGNAGNNLLDGGGGADILEGGQGNDIYYLDSSADVIIEGSAEGSRDVAYSAVDYVLADGAAVEVLTAIQASATNAINLTGNASNNEILGNAGNNILIGGAGRDTFTGFGGNDEYIVDQSNEVIYESIGNGTDTVSTSVNFTLAATSEIEVLRAVDGQSLTALVLTGNAFANRVEGNAGNNRLSGGGGADVLVGMGGDDEYVVNDSGTVIIETTDNGTDIVSTSVDFTLGEDSDIETLRTIDASATAPLVLTGNALSNRIEGNAGNNILNGGGGADTLVGGGGDDQYLIDDVGVTVTETAGNGTDTVSTSVDFTLAATTDIEVLRARDAASITALHLTGNILANRIEGNAGNNVIDGGGGADILVGLGGDDEYIVDDSGVIVAEATGGGTDIISTSVSLTLAADSEIELLRARDATSTEVLDLAGNSFANRIEGNAGNNRLSGGGGADVLVGMGGDDEYVVNDSGTVIIEATGNGTDTVSTNVDFTLGEASDIETLRTIDATAMASLVLTGNALANRIEGNAGNNILNGGGGADTLVGAGGDDQYWIDEIGVTIIEVGGGGIDTVMTSISLTLAADSDIEVLRARDAASLTALDLTGNVLANRIEGNAGNNRIDGGGGADILFGLGGDDEYIVTDSSVTVSEIVGGGVDTVTASVDYALAATSDIEILRTSDATATNALNLTGSASANRIEGNAGNNLLNGGAGNDVLIGALGNDTLIGGTGMDSLRGGDGNDIYYLDSASDAIVEGTNEGARDVAYSSVDYVLAEGAAIEVLSTIQHDATTAIHLTGNALNNEIWGNAGNNILTGSAGRDTFVGLGGDDEYIVDQSNEVIYETAGNGTDTVSTSVDFTLAATSDIEILRAQDITATTALRLTGNALANRIEGNAGNNRIDGGGGADILAGLGGDDEYIVDDSRVIVAEHFGNGADTITTSVGYTLAANSEIELLRASDALATTAFSLVGNAFANRIEGNAGNNVLNGGAGNDVLIGALGNDTLIGGTGADSLHGGDGNDIYYLDSASDAIVEGTNEGARDVAYSSVDYVLVEGAAIEVLSTIQHDATTAINLTGNALNNEIWGNAGNNILTGGAGRDTFVGLGGDDEYIVDQSNEVIYETAGNGTDTVSTSVDFTLAATSDIEILRARDITATTALRLTGNALANRIEGNAGNNVLNGGGGNDHLIGGTGDDVAVYRGLRAGYEFITADGAFSIRDSDAATDGDDGTDQLVGVEAVEFRNGERVAIVSPIVLDLTGNGFGFVNADDSDVGFDMNMDGIDDDTGWIGTGSGFLFLDRDRNGRVSGASELSYTQDVANARSDLEGLRVHDTNGDGKLNAQDAGFADFKIWRDGNQDGVADADEIFRLDELGIVELDLNAAANDATFQAGDVAVINIGSYTMADGTVRQYADAAFTYFEGLAEAASSDRPLVGETSSTDADKAGCIMPSPDLPADNKEANVAAAIDNNEQRANTGQVMPAFADGPTEWLWDQNTLRNLSTEYFV